MKDTTQATVRPWKLGGNFNKSHEIFIHGGKIVICKCDDYQIPKSKYAKANAQLIVTACNLFEAHEAVAEAAELAETYLEDGAPNSALRVIKNALARLATIQKENNK